MLSHLDYDRVEAYLLGHSTADEAERIELHLLACERCRELHRETAEFISTIREGLSRIHGVIATHRVGAEVVVVSVRPIRNRWIGRIRGDDVDWGCLAGSYETALKQCGEAFHSLFPEHDCCERCALFASLAR